MFHFVLELMSAVQIKLSTKMSTSHDKSNMYFANINNSSRQDEAFFVSPILSCCPYTSTNPAFRVSFPHECLTSPDAFTVIPTPGGVYRAHLQSLWQLPSAVQHCSFVHPNVVVHRYAIGTLYSGFMPHQLHVSIYHASECASRYSNLTALDAQRLTHTHVIVSETTIGCGLQHDFELGITKMEKGHIHKKAYAYMLIYILTYLSIYVPTYKMCIRIYSHNTLKHYLILIEK